MSSWRPSSKLWILLYFLQCNMVIVKICRKRFYLCVWRQILSHSYTSEQVFPPPALLDNVLMYFYWWLFWHWVSAVTFLAKVLSCHKTLCWLQIVHSRRSDEKWTPGFGSWELLKLQPACFCIAVDGWVPKCLKFTQISGSHQCLTLTWKLQKDRSVNAAAGNRDIFFNTR